MSLEQLPVVVHVRLDHNAVGVNDHITFKWSAIEYTEPVHDAYISIIPRQINYFVKHR